MAQSMASFRMDTDLKKMLRKYALKWAYLLRRHLPFLQKKLSRDRRMPFEIVADVPKEVAFQAFMEGINGFTGDCFSDGRELNVLSEEREAL